MGLDRKKLQEQIRNFVGGNPTDASNIAKAELAEQIITDLNRIADAVEKMANIR